MMNLDVEFRLLLLLSAVQAWLMLGKETGVRMCTMPEFLGLTQIFRSQQVFRSAAMTSADNCKAGWFPSRYVPNIRVSNQL